MLGMSSRPTFQVFSFSEDTIKPYKKQKTHRKTRSGCLTCKLKKVKCDEVRPICTRCQRNGRSCSYTEETRRAAPENANHLECSNNSVSILSTVPVSIDFDFLHNPEIGTSPSHLLQHFHAHWISVLHISRNKEIISISQSSQLVINTILLISASHLRHLAPSILEYRIAEHFQQSMVLRDLQRVLDMPRQQLGQCDVDALLLSATLLSIVAFALPSSENEPKTSWVFSNREDRLGWLGLQIGLRPLLLSMTTFIENTLNLLSPIFFGGKKFNRASHDLEKVPQHWKEFLELDDSASGDCDTQAPHDVFRAPISIIMQLRELEPIPSNLFKNLQFLGKVQQEFRALLLKSNNKALWLFGYWLGIMCRYKDVWWCEARSRRDHEAICLWLKQVRVEERPGREGEMWTRMMEELLMVPIWEPVS